MNEITSDRWWGEFEVPMDDGRFWQIGPLRLWVRRSSQEWIVSHDGVDDPLASSLAVAEAYSTEQPGPDAVQHRFAVRETGDRIRLLPALADRPAIVDPEAPLFVLAGEEIMLYVSTPLWFVLRAVVPDRKLSDAPLSRPSDTWFGPNPRSGELGYAIKTRARLSPRDLPRRPHRAISGVRILNRAATELRVEKLRLPARNLAVFSSANGSLWTETITLEREEDGDLAGVRIGQSPPGEAGVTERVSPPRERIEKAPLVRAFGGLFRQGGDRWVTG